MAAPTRPSASCSRRSRPACARSTAQAARQAPPAHCRWARTPAARRWREVAHVLLRRYPRRSVVVLAPDGVAGLLLQRDLLHLCAGAHALLRRGRSAGSRSTSSRSPLGNVLGPLLLGPLFDRDRPARDDRAATYALSGVGLAADRRRLLSRTRSTRRQQTLAWSAVFFLASAAASSAYLTVSEVFPLEMRAIVDLDLLRGGHRRRRLRRAGAVRRA